MARVNAAERWRYSERSGESDPQAPAQRKSATATEATATSGTQCARLPGREGRTDIVNDPVSSMSLGCGAVGPETLLQYCCADMRLQNVDETQTLVAACKASTVVVVECYHKNVGSGGVRTLSCGHWNAGQG